MVLTSHRRMQKKKNIFSTVHCVSGIAMLLALAWLTVSLPFVNAARQAADQRTEKTRGGESTENVSNWFSNTTEEKTESGTNSLSEYLHDTYAAEYPVTVIAKLYKCHPSDLYLAFHPESFSPPPEA